jgi:glycosyltransferase involved in cell wall biosynthesis
LGEVALMGPLPLQYCCYFDHRYLSRGLTMIRSLRAKDPSAVVWVLCLSDECAAALTAIEEPGLRLVRIADLEAAYPALAAARSNRSLIEYYFTCTPSLVCFALDNVEPGSIVTYVDSDLYFFSDPSPLIAELGAGSVSIVPHRFPPRLEYLEKYGLYNVGWMSFRNDARGKTVARWWQDRCNEWCYDVLDGDRFADQKYLDRIATDFEGVVIIEHRGANLAPWNVGGHALSADGDRLMVDGRWPLIFFHFHGLRNLGERIYIPGHFRYRAPFGRLMRSRVYRPYVQRLHAIKTETAPFITAATPPLARYSSDRINVVERLFSRLRQPAKDLMALLRGEFVVVSKAARPVRALDVSVAQHSGAPGPRVAADGLRIVVVHNYYGSASPSGENTVVNAEIEMLRKFGHDVHAFDRQSDEIRDFGVHGLVHGGLTYPWNPVDVARLKRLLRDLRPDIVHVHNTFPLISPGIFWTIRQYAPSVLTVHNYRMFCASALLLRDGRVCTRCLDERSVMPALRYGCYRKSRIATLPIAYSIALHNAIGTWRNQVDAFIAVTEFQRDRLIAAGLPRDRLHVKPNFFPGSPCVLPWESRRAALYVGRLSAEKGVEYLLRAWLDLGAAAPPLRIIGEGPLRGSLEQLAKSRGSSNIEFFGSVAPDVAVDEVSRARLLFVPSICYEGFPVVLQEAFAAGTPTAVSRVGALPMIVQDGVNGLVFEGSDPRSIAELVRRVWGDEALLRRLSARARDSFEANYTEEINHRRLREVYAAAGARRREVMGLGRGMVSAGRSG